MQKEKETFFKNKNAKRSFEKNVKKEKEKHDG